MFGLLHASHVSHFAPDWLAEPHTFNDAHDGAEAREYRDKYSAFRMRSSRPRARIAGRGSEENESANVKDVSQILERYTTKYRLATSNHILCAGYDAMLVTYKSNKKNAECLLPLTIGKLLMIHELLASGLAPSLEPLSARRCPNFFALTLSTIHSL